MLALYKSIFLYSRDIILGPQVLSMVRVGRAAPEQLGCYIVAMLSNRKKRQCSNRWHNVLDPSIDLVNGRTGK
jgi:hypothetical protein